ncbi:MAG: PAC2 family protein [Nanoarchaeota archaeon]|nr:PAC2 family protein [Nanoarchaeota archaeon]MBU1270343.1 PAC2 family protein [Nanoarchaeota archaeon]MBU1604658.1 PAC2 family protein [Nanoarchaeota archaeon]MBU2443135.1 PAC2 family protein [Nanoarchaeota archaeon]
MKIELKKKPQNPIIIQGFPGFGLIGTITTEFLLEHMNCELIGEFIYNDLPAIVAIHKGKLVKPMAVYYSKKHNVVILQTILNPKGKEWDIADAIIDLAKQLKAKKILCIEGVNSPPGLKNDSKLFYYGDDNLKKFGLEPINESIIIGVTSSLMIKYSNITCIFAETHSALPDSKSAAKVIEVLDKYLGLKVDYKPLFKQAEEFEQKLKGLIQQTSKVSEESDKKYMSYLG